MGDVGERTAVDQSRCVFDGLDQVRFDGILHEDGHSPFDAELAGRDQIAVQVIGYGDVAHAFLEVHEVTGQAEGCHDFRCDSNHEVVFPRETADFAAHADDDVAQGPVVHVHDALPDDAAHVDAQGIALVDVIIDGCGQEVVGSRNGMHVAGKMQVDVFHRQDLGVTTAGSTAFDAEDRSQGRFAQSDDGFMTHVVQGLGQADGRQGLAFTGRRRRNGRDQDQFPIFVLREAFDGVKRNLCFIFSVEFQVIIGEADLVCNGRNRFQFRLLCNFDIAQYLCHSSCHSCSLHKKKAAPLEVCPDGRLQEIMLPVVTPLPSVT